MSNMFGNTPHGPWRRLDAGSNLLETQLKSIAAFSNGVSFRSYRLSEMRTKQQRREDLQR